MSLAPLASQAIAASQTRFRTPMLVIPRQVTFCPVFFVDLASELLSAGVVAVRFDWLVDASLFRNHPAAHLHFWRDRRRVSRIDRALRVTHNGAALMELASVLSKPANMPIDGAELNPLAVGVCDAGSTLPDWAIPITAAVQVVTC